MHVLVAGATGNLGRALVHALLARDHAVTALARHPEKLGALRHRLAGVRRVDVTRPQDVAGACAGVDAVVSAVGLVGTRALRARQTHADVDAEGNARLIAEAARAGVDHFVYVSVQHAGAPAGGPLTEAKGRAEDALRASGMRWLVVRPTGYFDEVRTGILAQARRGVVFLAGDGSARLTPVAAADVAEWIAEHLADAERVQPAGGPETFTYDEMARLAFDVLGKRPRIVHVPLAAFDALTRAARPLPGAAYGELRFLRFAVTTDLVAPTVGERRLRDALAEGVHA